MGNFQIDATKFYWINEKADDPDDLCLHGHVVAFIGDRHLEDDCTVSATALYLLKSLTEDHIAGEDIQLLPCCGHFYIPDQRLENVVISGCDYGTDWTVTHSGGNVVLTLEDGTAVTALLEEYRQEVFRFADRVEGYYRQCAPKQLPEDGFTRDGYTAFWNEWHRRRGGKER